MAKKAILSIYRDARIEPGSEVGEAAASLLRQHKKHRSKVTGATHFVILSHEKYKHNRNAGTDSGSPNVKGAFFLTNEDLDTGEEDFYGLGDEIVAGFVEKKDLKALSSRSPSETFAHIDLGVNIGGMTFLSRLGTFKR